MDTTLPARSLAALALLMPFTADAQEPRYLCSGIGLEREEEEANFRHSLKLVFAQTDGHYIADVAATITSGSGAVLSETCPSPWLLVDLPAGSYKVTASYGGETKSATLQVSNTRIREYTFAFKP
ncbi:MAG: hypothetical protein AAFR44_00650 [Pseudomonadota bacterium]